MCEDDFNKFYCVVDGVDYKLVRNGYSDELGCCEGCVAYYDKELCHKLGDACGEHILYIWKREDTK